MTLLTVAGGVALILFGVSYLRRGLDRLFGPRVGSWLNQLADNPVKGFAGGVLAAAAVPSSTTISVLVAQAVQAGHMTARQMLAVVLGADIGVTLPVVLIALRLERYAPALILVGVVVYQFTTRQKSRGIGQTVLAVGFIFMGIDQIKTAAGTLTQNADMMDLIRIMEHYPWGMAVLAVGMTVALQSSTATISLALGLGVAGAISLPVAVAVVAGANVGIVVTTLIVGWRQAESRRLAVGNLLAKACVAVAVLAGLPAVAGWIGQLPGQFDQHVAYAHTGFNLAMAAVGLPLIGVIDRLAGLMVPLSLSTGKNGFGPRYINTGPIDSVSVALTQSMREIVHVAEIVRGMLGDLWKALKTDDEQLAFAVGQRDDQVDLLDTQIKRFLTRQQVFQGDTGNPAEQMRQLRYLNELENVGDMIDKNLSELVAKKVRLGADFSAEGWRELDDIYGKVVENMLVADAVFTTRDPVLAQQLLRNKERLNQYERELRDRHFARLKEGLAESHETSAIHLDILTHLKRINSCVSHAAYAILQDTQVAAPAT